MRQIVCETRAALFSYKAPFPRKDGFQCLKVFNETATEVLEFQDIMEKRGDGRDWGYGVMGIRIQGGLELG